MRGRTFRTLRTSKKTRVTHVSRLPNMLLYQGPKAKGSCPEAWRNDSGVLRLGLGGRPLLDGLPGPVVHNAYVIYGLYTTCYGRRTPVPRTVAPAGAAAPCPGCGTPYDGAGGLRPHPPPMQSRDKSRATWGTQSGRSDAAATDRLSGGLGLAGPTSPLAACAQPSTISRVGQRPIPSLDPALAPPSTPRPPSPSSSP